MQELLDLLKDGKSRSTKMLAEELGKPVELVERDIEFLERTGVIRRIEMSMCGSCNGCSTGDEKKTCPGCMPKDGFQNMGVMWEIV